MKNYFILNPAAGSGKFVGELSKRIIKVCTEKGVDFDVYVTKKEGDATDFVRETCESLPDGEGARFYSCGGDGTNYEVISGAYGFKNVSVGFVPAGTGNDFIRCFEDKENFHDIAAQLDGETDTIAKTMDAVVVGDVIDFVCDYYSYDGEYLDSYMLGDQLVVDGELTISDVYVDEEYCRMTYLFTDIYNQQYWSEPVK